MSTSQPAHTETPSPVALPWVERLVSMDTVSRNPNLGLIETVRDELRAARHRSTLTIDSRGQWANLFATVPAHDGADERAASCCRAIRMSVPVDGQEWDSDPFKPEIRDGRLYGRGTCDMKGFIGTALTLVPKCRRRSSRAPIHFALRFDEEVGCVGAPLMIADLHEARHRAGRLHRRRADRHAAGHRAQGHQRVSTAACAALPRIRR